MHFVGLRYSKKVMEKVYEMAKGIKVADAPIHTTRDELVAKVKKRGLSSSNESGEEACKRIALNVGDIVSESTGGEVHADRMVTDHESQNPSSSASSQSEKLSQELPRDLPDYDTPSTSSSKEKHLDGLQSLKNKSEMCRDHAVVSLSTTSSSQFESIADTLSVEAQYETHRENTVMNLLSSLPLKSVSHLSDFYQNIQSKSHATSAACERNQPQEKVKVVEKTTLPRNEQENVQEVAKSILPTKETAKLFCRLTQETVKEKQPFYNKLYKAVAWKLVAVGGFSPKVNFVQVLNSCVESLKATLDCFYIPLKEVADLPQNKCAQDSIGCELRCKAVYLGTGRGKCKDDAKLVASREALKLFLKKKVIVKICKRKYQGSEVDDLVLLDEDSKPAILAPALRNPQEVFQNIV
ncbi:CDKN2A-interacting protein isoform X2 [Protopterus annectens]|uniref:CDKN2A-interacting protein isoform X2 n=1 Tax=Protopterus annectens TaxID=7888 RepID=UPI001CF94179|nr:CDKN2A-interacting protein isoform X2 [Protopterus annectens]